MDWYREFLVLVGAGQYNYCDNCCLNFHVNTYCLIFCYCNNHICMQLLCRHKLATSFICALWLSFTTHVKFICSLLYQEPIMTLNGKRKSTLTLSGQHHYGFLVVHVHTYIIHVYVYWENNESVCLLLVLSSILDCDNYHDNHFNGRSSPGPNQQYLLYCSTPQLSLLICFHNQNPPTHPLPQTLKIIFILSNNKCLKSIQFCSLYYILDDSFLMCLNSIINMYMYIY